MIHSGFSEKAQWDGVFNLASLKSNYKKTQPQSVKFNRLKVNSTANTKL